MTETTLTSREVSEASGALPTTLRQWRDRNGLLPHLSDPASSKWARFSLSDALAVCVVHQLTKKGVAAQPAVNLANSLKEFLQMAAMGAGARFIGIGFSQGSAGEDQRLEFKALPDMGLVIDALGFFDDAVIIVLNIQSIAWELIGNVRKMRGLDDEKQKVGGHDD